MSTDSFIFIAVCLLLLPLQQIDAVGLDATGTILCLVAILTVGVSHGAIDNVLYGLNKKVSSNRLFIAVYLLAIACNVVLWLVSPNLGIASFLIISAYHFGQSQLSGLKNTQVIFKRSLYFLWGTSLIMALIHLNRDEIINYPEELSLLGMPFFSFLVRHSESLWLSSTLLWLVPLALFEIVVNRSYQNLMLQLYIIALINIAFSLFSVLTGFTLYFVILHSLRVLMQEYREIQNFRSAFNLRAFIKLLAPFTTVSIIGTVAIVILHQVLNWDIKMALLIAIIISSITLPHSYVMDLFYHRNQSKLLR